ncbi:MAG: hypothetical protein GWN73_12760, partial [Actinobacteria bacterium]|nr:hypothetical protein [Actinomycetota bacterium]NIS31075.1 hypothetical protein [Actinomycetota bacterium]NIU66236.1 hypothetical protein [Actinomycetota bacterium]NIW28053.1 hypothetical protein [Actinomycetota bacterium]
AGGEHLASWGRPGTESGAFSTPHSVWVDGGDRVLVVDRENDRVEVFSRDGAHLTSWRGFHRPMDICEDGGGRFLITDQTPRLSRVDA